MFFDLQRFDDVDTSTDVPQTDNNTPEITGEELQPIPEELDGIPEDIARDAIAEWAQTQATQESTPEEQPISREDYQAKLAEIEQLKAQIAQAQSQPQQAPAQQPVQQQPHIRQPYQLPPIQVTPEFAAKMNEAIKEEAMKLSGMSADEVDSLQFADTDDPRLDQWNQATSLAKMNVLGQLQQARVFHQQQVNQFLRDHDESIQVYNDFTRKEFADPDYKNTKNFAVNEFFNQRAPKEQEIIAKSYARIEKQTASPAEMLAVKLYYELAKTAYHARGAKATAPKTAKPAPKSAGLPRIDQLNGTSGKGEVTVAELEHMLETNEFDNIPKQYQSRLLGY